MEAHPQTSPSSTRSRESEEERRQVRKHAEALLDEALEATFPCSDPVSTLMVDEADNVGAPEPPKKS